jgi:hypothetical protein
LFRGVVVRDEQETLAVGIDIPAVCGCATFYSRLSYDPAAPR